MPVRRRRSEDSDWIVLAHTGCDYIEVVQIFMSLVLRFDSNGVIGQKSKHRANDLLLWLRVAFSGVERHVGTRNSEKLVRTIPR